MQFLRSRVGALAGATRYLRRCIEVRFQMDLL